MSLCEFIGETKNISHGQLQFISEQLKKLGYAGKQVSISSVGKAGDNYSSYVNRFTTNLENGDMFNMVAKIAPPGQLFGEDNLKNDIFANETLLYNEILPKFRQLQEDANIPEEDKLRYPICYGAQSEPKNEIILLEDLDVKNYVMFNKTEPLNENAIKLILKSIANFHSMSYVIKNKDSQTYGRFKKLLADLLVNNEMLSKVKTLFQVALNDMKSIFHEEMYINAISTTLQDLAQTGMEVLLTNRCPEYSILQHGDLWTNNIMFKMQDDQPVECILIDYQMARENLPVADIHSLIFNCTDYETRSKHYYEWIDYYHSELDRYLNYFGLKAEHVYPRDQLDADLKTYAKPCLGFAFMMLNFQLRQTQEAPDMSVFENLDATKMMNEISMKTLMGQTVDALKKRIKGLIDSCFEYGYLSEPIRINKK